MSLFQTLYESLDENLGEGFHNILAAKIHGDKLEKLEQGTSEFNLTKAKYHRQLKQHYGGLATIYAKNGDTESSLKHSNISNFHAKREKHFQNMI